VTGFIKKDLKYGSIYFSSPVYFNHAVAFFKPVAEN
jgi:hypothetical protein